MYIFLGKNTLQEKNACYLGNFNGETFSSKQTKSPRSPASEGHIDDIPTAHDSGTVLKKDSQNTVSKNHCLIIRLTGIWK